MYQEVVVHIDNILSLNRGKSFIIAADFNCNIFNSSHPYKPFIRDLMKKYDLLSSFDYMTGFDVNTSFTRSDVKTDSYTLIDGILISRNLVPFIKNVRISRHGDNVSDHNPVELDLMLSVCASFENQKRSRDM